MAAPNTPTGTIQHIVYAKSGNGSKDENTYAKLVASGKIINTANKLGDCIAFGPISATGNPSEWTPMGEGTTKSIAGAASLGELTIRVVATEGNTLHNTLLNMAVGAKLEAAVVKTDSGDTSKDVAYYAYGTLASKETTFETPGEFGFTIALAANVQRSVKA